MRHTRVFLSACSDQDRPEKARQAKSKVKSMLNILFDIKGIVHKEFVLVGQTVDRLCGLVVRVLGYRSGDPGSIPGTTRKKKRSGSGTGSTQPHVYN
jgi:hypothetical protein